MSRPARASAQSPSATAPATATATATANRGFEGVAGRVAAAVMARLNRDMERAAIAALDPAPGDDVLSIGFGPGVGVRELVAQLPDGCIAGIDPSPTMLELAQRRNRDAVDAGQVTLVEAAADAIPFPDGVFRGVLAVNSMQLWRPLDVSLREVARVLAPDGALVAVTHVWAIEKRAPLQAWLEQVMPLLDAAGLDDVRHATGSFRSGAGVVLSAHKSRHRNRFAP